MPRAVELHRLIVQAALALTAIAACGPVSHVADQTYLGASHNWVFRDRFPEADRLFNAFDYGHAVLYEHLLRDGSHRDSAARTIEGREFSFITSRLLVHPPRLPLEERALAPAYTRLVPELFEVFEWAHILHRQLYDVLADPRLDSAARDRRVADVLRYYASRRDLALSMRPKGMALMEGAPYSLVFRKEDPKFNGLLWSYHWYQLVLYDALLASNDTASQRAGVDASTAHFWNIIADAPAHMPTTMPLAAAVAPLFATRYPDAAIVFDNLHSLHDVIADILASPLVPSGQKRTAMLRAMSAFQDSTTAAMSREEWRSMALDMGVDKMGGVAPHITPMKDDLRRRP